MVERKMLKNKVIHRVIHTIHRKYVYNKYNMNSYPHTIEFIFTNKTEN